MNAEELLFLLEASSVGPSPEMMEQCRRELDQATLEALHSKNKRFFRELFKSWDLQKKFWRLRHPAEHSTLLRAFVELVEDGNRCPTWFEVVELAKKSEPRLDLIDKRTLQRIRAEVLWMRQLPNRPRGKKR